MNSNTWKSSAFKSYAVVAVLVIIAIITSMSLSSGSPKPTKDTNAGTDDSNTTALIDILTVKTVNVDCVNVLNANGGSTRAVDGKTYVVYDIGALKPVPPRKWSDAISTPMKGKSPPTKREYTQAEVCQNPHYGVTLANFFANLNVDGVNIGDLNPWLAPYKGSPKTVNDKAAAFMPLLDVSNASEEQANKAAQKNLEYQEFAAKLDTLLGRFKLDGVKRLKSVMNLHLVAGGLKVGGLPEVGINRHQEHLPALVLSVTLKGACAPAKVIGINTGDMRPEVFATPTCKTPSTSTPSTECKGSPCKPTPACKHNCSPIPVCKHNCTPPTPHQCPCIDPTEAAQPVPTPDPGPSGVPTHEPSAQPTVPVNTSSPAPPTPGGYNGGSTQQPGQTASPTPVVPSDDPTNGGDPGGF
jgi:hypothetical protein